MGRWDIDIWGTDKTQVQTCMPWEEMICSFNTKSTISTISLQTILSRVISHMEFYGYNSKSQDIPWSYSVWRIAMIHVLTKQPVLTAAVITSIQYPLRSTEVKSSANIKICQDTLGILVAPNGLTYSSFTLYGAVLKWWKTYVMLVIWHCKS